MAERGWYRVHWVTWLAMFLVGGSLVYSQFLAQGPICGLKHVGFGWPFVYLLKPVRVLVPPRSDEWNQAGLLLSVLCCLLITGSTMFVLQSRRTRSPRFQFTLGGLLAAVAAVAVLLALVQERFAIHRALDLESNFAPNWSTPGWCYVWVPTLFGLGCTTYAAGRLAVRLVVRDLIVRPLRSVLASVAAHGPKTPWTHLHRPEGASRRAGIARDFSPW